ncbi:MAG TPA: 4-hydroxy-tetrahydrodipicolinate synthase [Rectinemataceae bacterium]|nr:4-hydroxy-tetrahydrodipicolinate synthase [Rectinemataceae bacterium]
MLDIDRLRGLGVALATPFLPAFAADGRPSVEDAGGLDIPAWRRLVRHVSEGGADFLVVLGSTGEGATVLESERDELMRAAREECGGRPLVLGTGHNSTAQAVTLAKQAVSLGADAILVVTPYYNKPQIAGLEAHYRAIAAAAPAMPIIVYNVPGRTGMNLGPKDLSRLWAIPQVVAVKESSGNLGQIAEIVRSLPPGKLVLSGDDGLALAEIAVGVSGLISVAGNLLPAEFKALVEAALAGRREEAASLNALLVPVMDAMFLESNPTPLKAALAIAGICGESLRLPLAKVQEATRARIAETIAPWLRQGARP